MTKGPKSASRVPSEPLALTLLKNEKKKRWTAIIERQLAKSFTFLKYNYDASHHHQHCYREHCNVGNPVLFHVCQIMSTDASLSSLFDVTAVKSPYISRTRGVISRLSDNLCLQWAIQRWNKNSKVVDLSRNDECNINSRFIRRAHT